MGGVNTMHPSSSFLAQSTVRLGEWLRTVVGYLDNAAIKMNCSSTLQTVPVWNRSPSNRLARPPPHAVSIKFVCRLIFGLYLLQWSPESPAVVFFPGDFPNS